MQKSNVPTIKLSAFCTILASSVLLTACGGGSSEDAAADEANQTHAEHSTHITVLQLEPTRFEHFFTVQGVVETDQNAQLYPEAPARIVSINAKEGDRVSQGQVLMVLDSRVIDNQMEELKLRLDLAELIFKKQEGLWSQEIGSEIQYLEAKNNFESLEQNLETLKAQKALYTIKAPFSGILDEINPKEGEMANPAMPVARLINMERVYIKSDVTERYLATIKAGDAVVVNFPSLGIVKNTTIQRLGNFINPANRTFKVRLSLDNSDLALKPNLLGELKIRDYSADSAAVIPTSLIQSTPSGQEFIYILEDSKAKKVEITTGISYEGHVEVLSGLMGTETLIDKGARSVKDGDLVSIES